MILLDITLFHLHNLPLLNSGAILVSYHLFSVSCLQFKNKFQNCHTGKNTIIYILQQWQRQLFSSLKMHSLTYELHMTLKAPKLHQPWWTNLNSANCGTKGSWYINYQENFLVNCHCCRDYWMFWTTNTLLQWGPQMVQNISY